MRARETGLIAALDDPDLAGAEKLAKELAGSVSACKVGLTLYAENGPDAIDAIAAHTRVFCDFKLHDIPAQVGRAASLVAARGAWMLTVHASGGADMIRAAVAAAGDTIVAGVTVLTSLAAEDLAAVGQGTDPGSQALRLGALAVGSGTGALVCSGREVAALRRTVGDRILLVVPGVRPLGSERLDQRRTVTPAEAAAAGADYVVVGRPITGASDPASAAAGILGQLKAAAE